MNPVLQTKNFYTQQELSYYKTNQINLNSKSQ